MLRRLLPGVVLLGAGLGACGDGVVEPGERIVYLAIGATGPNDVIRAFAEIPTTDVTRERIEEFNEAIREQAEEHDVLVVDTHREPVEDDLVSDADGFHPNNRGHQRIAERFLEVILPALGLAPVS